MIKTLCKSKNLICIVLVITILFANMLTISADNFTHPGALSDLIVNGVSHWAKSFIDSLVEKGIIVGYPDGTFKPNNSVEVDAFIKMVVVSLGYDIEKGTDYWALPYINKAKELKLIDGTEFNTYRRVITREEAAKIIVNALATKEQLPSEEQIYKYVTRVPDCLKISEHYRKYALYAYATGLIVGNQSGYFNPKNNLSRAEASIVVMKVLDASLRQPINIDEYLSDALPELLKSDEEVWALNDLDTAVKMSNVFREYDLRNGKLYFKNEPDWSNILLKETLNPDINRQIHDLTKVLIDKSHYVPTFYVPPMGDQPGYVCASLSKSYGYFSNSSYFFGYTLFEDKFAPISGLNNNFSKSATIELVLNQLWWSINEDGSLYNPSKDGWSVQFYRDKLKKSLMSLFGIETGNKLYQYIYSVYVDERTKQDSQVQRFKTITIDNIQIDFYNDAAPLYFYFTVKK